MLPGLRLYAPLARSAAAGSRQRLRWRSRRLCASTVKAEKSSEEAMSGLRGTSASDIIDTDRSLTSHRQHRARPLSNTADVVLYKSSVDIQEIVMSARQNCLVGGGLAVAGFGVLIASIAPAMPPAVFAAMLGGAA